MPRFSVFTPSHRSTYLLEAYQSLVAQTCADWEWVLVLNGGLTEVPRHIAADARVRVLLAPSWLAGLGVGALKRFACEAATGRWLVELDHDDLLLPTALEKIGKADEAGAEFVYSDAANFRADGSCEVFDARYGWTSYEVEAYGRKYQAMRSFAPSPSSLQQIYYAPNHFRAWRRDTYLRVGGHDATLPVADDHDLVCRTYLAGAKFVHVPECLYLYRLQPDGQNTYLLRNAEIQTRQQAVANRYVYGLVAEWCRRESLHMIDLGGAHNCPPGYKSVDLVGADVNCDIRDGLPFPDNSVGCVRAYDFLEHIPRCPDSACTHNTAQGRKLCTVGLMNEIYRVLAPGGWLLSRTPSTDGRGAFQDPTHVSFWNPNSFWYYTRSEQAKFVPGINCRFQGTRIWQEHPSEWDKQHNILYVFADLVALKGQAQPGICEI